MENSEITNSEITIFNKQFPRLSSAVEQLDELNFDRNN